MDANNRSGFKGASYLKQSVAFRTRINVLGLSVDLGYFKKAPKSAEAYEVAQYVLDNDPSMLSAKQEFQAAQRKFKSHFKQAIARHNTNPKEKGRA